MQDFSAFGILSCLDWYNHTLRKPLKTLSWMKNAKKILGFSEKFHRWLSPSQHMKYENLIKDRRKKKEENFNLFSTHRDIITIMAHSFTGLCVVVTSSDKTNRDLIIAVKESFKYDRLKRHVSIN